MIDNTSEVMIEIVQEVSLLGYIRQQLVIVEVIFEWIFGIEMLLDRLKTVLNGRETLEADFS